MTRLARLAATGTIFAALLSAQPAIRLRNRVITGSSRKLLPARHQIIQFESYPDASVRQELSRRGVRVLGYVPDNALMVSVTSPASLNGMAVRSAVALQAGDKISRGLASRAANAYLAMFHADVNPERARELVRASGFDVIENAALAPAHLVITGSYDRLADLAARDELAFVMEASTDLLAGVAVLACPEALAAAGGLGEYAASTGGWTKDANGTVALKYALLSFTSKLDANSARGEFERAFREWSKYANLTFSDDGTPDSDRTIAVQFATGLHGDLFPFDGPGNILAHTYFPAAVNPEPVAGDMHLDADEDWHIGSGTDLFSVVLHETGHALGLPHSTDPASVMYPYYRIATGLGTPDVVAIQNLYGAPASGLPALPTEPTPPAVPPVSTDPTVPPVPPTPTEPTAPTTPPPPPVPPTRTPTPPTPPTTAPAPPSGDRTAPSLHIVTPSVTILSTFASSITIAGTASDNVGVASVAWSTSSGSSGTASGTTSWFATIPLWSGTNVITVRVYDAAGNSAWRSLTVVKP